MFTKTQNPRANVLVDQSELASGDMVVTGRFRSPWGHWILNKIWIIAPLAWAAFCVIDTLYMRFILQTPPLAGKLFVFLYEFIPSSLQTAGSFFAALFVFSFGPAVIAQVLPRTFVIRYLLVKLMPRRQISIRFTHKGVQIEAGKNASPKTYLHEEGDIAFQLIDHPRVRHKHEDVDDYDPFIDTGRVQMTVGIKHIVLIDILNRESALRFIESLIGALEQTTVPAKRMREQQPEKEASKVRIQRLG